MKKEVHYLMTQEQLKKYTVISMAAEGRITIGEAARKFRP
jgi:hypothetical protein